MRLHVQVDLTNLLLLEELENIKRNIYEPKDNRQNLQ